MTVTATPRVAGPFIGNASATNFAFGFKVFAKTDIQVAIYLADGTPVATALDSNYSVTLNADQANSPGGFVTYPISGSPLAAGGTLTIAGALPYDQTLGLPAGGNFNPLAIERAFDRTEIQIQQLLERQSRAFTFSLGEGAIPVFPPIASRANKLLGFDASGNFIGVLPSAGDATTLALDLLNKTNVAKGAGLVGFNPALLYDASTVGRALVVTQPSGVSRATNVQALDTISAKGFGVVGDNVADDTAAVNAMFAYAATLANGGIVKFPPGMVCKITGAGLTIDTNKVGIDGGGVEWNFAGLTAGAYALTITQSEPGLNLRTQKNRSHPIRGIRMNGATGTPTAYGIKLDDPTNSLISGVVFGDGAISGFIRDVSLMNGSFFTSFDNWDFTNDDAGHKSSVNVYLPNAANAGERNNFSNCRFGVVGTENFTHANGNASTTLVNCSFNYGLRMATITGGAMYIVGGHIEGANDADWWFHLSTAGNPLLVISATSIVMAAAKTAKAFAYVDAAVNTTGLVVRDVMVAASNAITVPWADGTGRVVISNVGRYTSGGACFSVSDGQNALAYGDFESANYVSEFALLGPTPPARSNTTAFQGAWSLRYQGIASQANYTNTPIPCSPGQVATFFLRYQTVGFTGTGTTFQAQIQYMDVGGNVISASQIFSTMATSGGWTLVSPAAAFAPAPPGTRSINLQILISGTTSGTPLGYVDAVKLAAV